MRLEGLWSTKRVRTAPASPLAAVATLLISCATAPPLPDTAVPKEKISVGDEPHLPDSFVGPGCGGTVSGAYRMCLQKDGSVGSVDVVQGIPFSDDGIVSTLAKWRYRPVAFPICFVQNLVFRINCKGAPTDSQETLAANPPPPAAPVAAPAPSPPPIDARLASLWFLSADTRELSYFRADKSFLLRWLLGQPGVTLPACVAELTGKVESHYMLAAGKQRTVNLFSGSVGRGAVESCAVATMGALGKTVSVRRDGALTEFAEPKGVRSYAAFTDDGWLLWSDERALLTTLLGQKQKPKPTVPAGLSALLGRVEAGATRWSVSTSDTTQRFLGVPSSGYLVTFPEETGPAALARVSFVFATAEAANSAAALARKKLESPEWSEKTRQTLLSLSPRPSGNMVTVELSPGLFEPGVMEEVLSVVQGPGGK